MGWSSRQLDSFFLPRLFACNFHRLLLLPSRLVSSLPVPSLLLPLPVPPLLLRRKVQINLWRPTVTFLAVVFVIIRTLSAACLCFAAFLLLLLLLLSHFPKNSEMRLVIAFENRIR